MCSKKIPFTSSERELIIALVRERPIIEDKRTCSKNIVLKKEAWEELTVAYNSHEYVSQRNSIQLKRCWENIKSQRKKELSLEAASLRCTGGGPPDAGSTISDHIVDLVCPSINLKVPGVIDSNTIELPTTNLVEKQCLPKHTTDLKKQKSEYDVSFLDFSTGKSKENVPPLLKRNLDDIEAPSTSSKITCTVLSGEFGEFGECHTPQKKTPKDFNTPKGNKNLIRETLARIHRTELNTQHDQALFELRMEREKILIQREKNILEYEKHVHKLQIEKLELEIDILKQKNNKKT